MVEGQVGSLGRSGSRPQSIPLARYPRITKWEKNVPPKKFHGTSDYDRNLDASQPSSSRDLALPLLRLAQPLFSLDHVLITKAPSLPAQL